VCDHHNSLTMIDVFEQDSMIVADQPLFLAIAQWA
jgi:hypothetical protein